MTAFAGGPTVLAQATSDEVARLTRRVDELEKQIQEMSRLLEPLKVQKAADERRKVLREKFEQAMAADQAKYSKDQLREAEQLYQVANQKWGSPEAEVSLKTLIQKYPDINRTGCAVLYVAQKSKGEARASYFRECIEKYNDCFYGDGVQVGVYARFLWALDYRSEGDTGKADALIEEIRRKYPLAVDHSGNPLLYGLKPAAN